MSYSGDTAGKIVPAQLNFLSIYSPDLVIGEVDEHDQIVFYHSRAVRDRQKRRTKGPSSDAEVSNDASNEQLRQVGLAQGMVAFARDFANGEPIDSVETEKHRVVLKELEPGWWILASINLTRLPNTKPGPSATTTVPSSAPSFDYSSREVSPPALLTRQLERAHSIFLLHHGQSLSDLWVRNSREKFCDLLDRFWTKFASSWDVLLHGNPSVDLYGGIKLAAGGELGIGVGEEDWGSGERDVLEGLVRNTDGLVDLAVSRFGDPIQPEPAQKDGGSTWIWGEQHEASTSRQSMGNGHYPGPADGMIFSGLGIMTRPALRALTDWMAWIYTHGEDAYGIRDHPSSTRRRRRKRMPAEQDPNTEQPSNPVKPKEISHRPGSHPLKQESSSLKGPPEFPPPIVSATEKSLKEATKAASKTAANVEDDDSAKSSTSPHKGGISDPDQWVKYLTLGYGSVWGGGASWTGPSKAQAAGPAVPKTQPTTSAPAVTGKDNSEPAPTISGGAKPRQGSQAQRKQSHVPNPSSGYFLVGLKGDLDAEDQPSPADEDGNDANGAEEQEEGWNSRLSLRTVYVETWKDSPSTEKSQTSGEGSSSADSTSSTRKMRVVVYIHAPFIYTLLFDPTAMSLSMSSSFHDLHHHLTPLQDPLLRSTSPTTIASRLRSTIPLAQTTIYDLVHSPRSLTTHCSIPNIPVPGTLAAEGLPNILSASSSSTATTSWSRLEALNVHSQILSTYVDTRRRLGEHERTAKTGKGWWVMWMRVPTTESTQHEHAGNTTSQGLASPLAAQEQDATISEAILVRKAAESKTHSTRSWTSVGSYGLSASRRTTYGGTSALRRLVGREDSGSSGADASVAAGVGSSGRLAEGMGAGVDPKKYVEVLLSLCR